jgi:hypothetical protein
MGPNLRIRECTPDYQMHVNAALPHYLAASCDNGVGKGTKFFFGFATIEKFLAWYDRQNPKCCYEILRSSLPVAVAFDIECETDDERHCAVRAAHGLSLDADRFLGQLVHVVVTRLPQLAPHPPFVSSSHAVGRKLSFHLKFEFVILPTMADRDRFKQLVLAVFGDFVPVIDPSVYSKNKNMRLLFSSKWGSTARPLVAVGAETAPFSAAAVAQHMWCTSHADAVPFDFAPYTSEAPRASLMEESSSISRKSSSISRKRSREAHATDDSWVVAVRNLLRIWDPPTPDRSLSACADLEVQVKRRDAFGPGGAVYFFTQGSRTCPHGFVHVSDNFGVFVSDSGAAYLHCFSSECAGLRDQFLGSICVPTRLLPAGEAVSGSYSEAASHKLSAAVTGADRLWLAKDVEHVNWSADQTLCTIELRAESARNCMHCGIKTITTIRVDDGARVTHDGKAKGLPCNLNVRPLFVFQKAMHLAFADKRKGDSRFLEAAERRAVAQTLGFPAFLDADAGWSACMEMCVVLRARDEHKKFLYLVLVGGASSSFVSVSSAPWALSESTRVPFEVIKKLLQISV